jgi:hypothetical protein
VSTDRLIKLIAEDTNLNAFFSTERWLSFLNWSIINSTNIFMNHSTTYLSAPAVLDIFFANNHVNKPNMRIISKFFRDHNNSSLAETHALFAKNYKTIDYDYFNCEADNLPSELAKSIRSVTNSIVEVCNIKNDVVGLLSFLPQYKEEIQAFDIDFLESDTSLLDELTTPDTKMYYPEPFIASPSFVHEDL